MLIIIPALLMAAALALYLIWANGALSITRCALEFEGLPEGFDGFVIAQVSDLHNASFGEGNEKLLGALRDAEPDIIAVTGDLVDSRHTDIGTALAFIEAAAEIAPVYYVTGNHEARLDFEAIERGLIDAGARLLRGESVELRRGGGSITLAGIDDPAFIKGGGSAAERAEAQLSSLGRGGFTVLLAHRPELIESYAGYADLVLSGHAHGGQVRLPFIGGLYAPGQGLLPEYDAGIYGRGGCTLIVSRGLGNSLFPLRVNNRPELVTVELRSAG